MSNKSISDFGTFFHLLPLTQLDQIIRYRNLEQWYPTGTKLACRENGYYVFLSGLTCGLNQLV